MSELEHAVELEAADTAAEVAEAVSEVVAEEAAADAVEELAEAVIEHVDEALDDMRDVVEDQEEDEQWLRLTNELQAMEARLLTQMQAMLATASSSAPPELTEEQETALEALEGATAELEGAEAEVLEFDPEAVAPEASADQAAPARRRVRGLQRRR